MSRVPSAEERRAWGQAQRKKVRRQDLHRWDVNDRTTDPMEALAASAKGRVPKLLKIRWQRMAASPFGFFRGAVAIMAADLALLPRTKLVTQLCGDAHLENLGAYAAPDGRLVFDINDFDETIRGPFEWDVKRLATSVLLAGRAAGSGKAVCTHATGVLLDSYLQSMHAFARMPVLDVARFTVHGLHRSAPVSGALLKAERATPLANVNRLTVPSKSKGERVFVEHKPLQYRLPGAQGELILKSLRAYRETLLPERQHLFDQYRALDVAFRVVGTGSVGLLDYVVYMEGNGNRDPLFLQIKEEPRSTWAAYLGKTGAPRHQGRRVVEGQRAMQFMSDLLLGWTTIGGRQFLVRQLNDHKAAIQVGSLKGDALSQYAQVCGELLARGHARSGDPMALAGYLGNSARFVEAVGNFALDYAEQTEKDYKTFLRSKFVPRGK